MRSRRRESLLESARLLRVRLAELEAARVPEQERAIHEVALDAVREALSEVGRLLAGAA